ncbi:hypothetical protein B835_2514 [Enterococcus mundtii 3F]|nr:hypothetical protein [Enterococcus mundtii 3F]
MISQFSYFAFMMKHVFPKSGQFSDDHLLRIQRKIRKWHFQFLILSLYFVLLSLVTNENIQKKTGSGH